VLWVLMSFEPLSGWRELALTERRRKREVAHRMRGLAEEVYPQAQKRSGWCWTTSLHPHRGGLLRELLGGGRPRSCPKDRVSLHPGSPGSWPNMVMVEISMLVRQCLKRRLPDMHTLAREEAQAWREERNRAGASVDWRFKT
jgi:hypothetical protein